MANELVFQKLKETFERNENVTVDCNGTNIWVMLVAAEPFSDLLAENLSYPLTDQKPTHRVRVVLRTTDAQAGTNPYVDGSDFFLVVVTRMLHSKSDSPMYLFSVTIARNPHTYIQIHAPQGNPQINLPLFMVRFTAPKHKAMFDHNLYISIKRRTHS